jgi:hypothetical protein
MFSWESGIRIFLAVYDTDSLHCRPAHFENVGSQQLKIHHLKGRGVSPQMPFLIFTIPSSFGAVRLGAIARAIRNKSVPKHQ